MQMLFKHTDLEIRVPLNLNVLKQGKVPSVLSLREALDEFLKHQFEVLVRRTKNRKEKVEVRLEVLKGYQIVYLHLDDVIKILRESDHPERELKKKWKLNDTQVNSILSMRLRQLKKLEEKDYILTFISINISRFVLRKRGYI